MKLYIPFMMNVPRWKFRNLFLDAGLLYRTHVVYNFAIGEITRKGRERNTSCCRGFSHACTYIFIFESYCIFYRCTILTAKLFNCILTLDQVSCISRSSSFVSKTSNKFKHVANNCMNWINLLLVLPFGNLLENSKKGSQRNSLTIFNHCSSQISFHFNSFGQDLFFFIYKIRIKWTQTFYFRTIK